MDPITFTKRLLRETTVCVLSTASLQGKPSGATMHFVDDDDLNIYFETLTTYRKYKNIQENKQASIVVTNEPFAIQMEGIVQELSKDEAEKAKQKLMVKYGEKEYHKDSRTRFFKFIPSWIKTLIEPGFPPRYEIIKGN